MSSHNGIIPNAYEIFWNIMNKGSEEREREDECQAISEEIGQSGLWFIYDYTDLNVPVTEEPMKQFKNDVINFLDQTSQRNVDSSSFPNEGRINDLPSMVYNTRNSSWAKALVNIEFKAIPFNGDPEADAPTIINFNGKTQEFDGYDEVIIWLVNEMVSLQLKSKIKFLQSNCENNTFID